MNIEKIVNPEFLTKSRTTRLVLPALVFLSVSAAIYCVFLVVPNERVMGAVQRIFYFHVGLAMASYLMIGLLFLSSIFFLHSRKDEWDVLAEASASVGLLFCSIVLASGMIWGHSAWNVWWRWEPRLVSFLVLWLILFSYTMLRAFSEEDGRQKNFAAVLGIIAAVNVPIVIFSVKLLDHSEQLHPEVVAKQGLRDASFVYTLILANVAMLLFSLWLASIRSAQGVLSRKSLEIAARAE